MHRLCSILELEVYPAVLCDCMTLSLPGLTHGLLCNCVTQDLLRVAAVCAIVFVTSLVIDVVMAVPQASCACPHATVLRAALVGASPVSQYLL